MDANLRQHFDRAVSADPGADPGEMAHAAIVQGGRVRRRRRQTAVAGVAAGIVAALGVAAGVNHEPEAPGPANPPLTVAAAMMPVAAPSCTEKPVEHDATDVILFLAADAAERQRSAIMSALDDDARVESLEFESREQAFDRFRRLWADSPDFVAAVSADQMPESFRVRLVDAAQYSAFRAEYEATDGVDDVLGRVCPSSAPVGGVQ